MSHYSKHHLAQKGRAWRYRRRVPKHLVAIVGRGEWFKYLGLIGHRAAVAEARVLDVEHDRLIAKLDAMPDVQRADVARNGGLPAMLQDLQVMETALPFVELSSANFDEPKVDIDAHDALDQIKEIRETRRAGAALRTKINASHAIVAATGKGAASTGSLESLVDVWQRVAQPRNPKTVHKMRLYVRRITDFVGNLEPKDITRAHIAKFRDALEDRSDLSRAAIQQHLNFLHRLFGVALSENLIASNPVQGVKVAKLKGIRFADENGREPFSGEQVSEIFAKAEGESADLRWIIRLLAYHGMRSGEVCQLRVADVTLLTGVPVLRVTDEAGSLKNRFSMRDVPIHPQCLEIVDFAAAVKGPWLFESFSKTTDKGGKFQRWGGAFLRKTVKISDTSLTMHSLRHTWRTCAREISMPEQVSRAIMGHSMGRDDHAGYGGVPSLKQRADWMARIDPLKA